MTDPTTFAFEDERSAREAAALLRELAAGVERGRIEFDEDATVDVANELAVELEFERGGTDSGGVRLAVELEWAAPDERATAEAAAGREAGEDVTAVEEGTDGTDEDALPEPPAAPEEVRARGESLARFQVFRDRRGEWRWRLVHRNGNVIADSGEGYTARHNAEKGLRSVKANAPGADVEFSDE